MTRRMKYVGPDPRLVGLTALVRDDPLAGPFLVAAQFDDLNLVIGGANMGHGWHLFRDSEFEDVAK